MGIDALLKRFFPAVVLVLIGIAAYFQASGMGELVASSVAVDPSSIPTAVAGSKHAPGPAPANTDHSTSGAAILSRNPFDSVTGPLDGKPASTEEQPSAPAPDNSGDPSNDPYCDAVKVILIAESADDPEWSFAALAGGDGKSTLRRIGDEINGFKVHDIGWDKKDREAAVWLMSGSNQRCKAIMGGKPPVAKTASPSASSSPVPEPTIPSPTGKGRRGKVPAEISSKIHKIDDTHFSVERTAIDQVLEKQAELFRSVRVVPGKEGTGLYGIRPDSLLGMLGIENGDSIQSINGIDLSDPSKAMEAYAKLKSTEQLTVSVMRRGKPTNISVEIK
jgi:general secretion pathway protein C